MFYFFIIFGFEIKNESSLGKTHTRSMRRLENCINIISGAYFTQAERPPRLIFICLLLGAYHENLYDWWSHPCAEGSRGSRCVGAAGRDPLQQTRKPLEMSPQTAAKAGGECRTRLIKSILAAHRRNVTSQTSSPGTFRMPTQLHYLFHAGW